MSPGVHKLRRATGADYFPLFSRIEEKFSPEEMDDATLKDYINASTSGMNALAEQLSQTRELALQIEESSNIKELKGLRKEVDKLEVHSATLRTRINEKILSVGVGVAGDFAEERRISLTERVVGNVEVWKDGRERIVIREKGRLRAWRLVN